MLNENLTCSRIYCGVVVQAMVSILRTAGSALNPLTTFNLHFFLKKIKGIQKKISSRNLKRHKNFMEVQQRGEGGFGGWNLSADRSTTCFQNFPIPPCALAYQNYPRPPCAHAEKLTGTSLRAQFLQIEKISHITNATKKTILLQAGELRVPPRVPAGAISSNEALSCLSCC